MTIVNRRNAIVGWLTLKAAKIVVREEARTFRRKLRRTLPLGHKR
jgi:hypothetical protein